jgi:AcrR family transcriptional regulator
MAITTGRPRDAAIDEAVLEATLRQLARDGMTALSLASVAAEAGTTRPAIYRRWKDKTALVVDAVAHLARVAPPPTTGEPFTDLVAELEHFRHCITEAAALPLAGLMMGDGVEPAVREQYTREVVRPRRTRIRACLDAAVAQGDLPADADLAVAGSFLTGSWYAFALTGTKPPHDWARRTAVLVWRACGGTLPPIA